MILPVSDKPDLTPERREYLRTWQKNQRLTDNEIHLPDCAYPKLRAEFKTDLEAYLRKGFPDLFCDPFGSVQKDMIRRTQKKLIDGGRDLNNLLPRGYAKSSIGLLARPWAILNGYRRLCMVTSSSSTKATQLMRMATMAICNNDILLGCYPELWAFHALQGNPQKPLYQTYEGEKTDIRLRANEIQFPDLGDDCVSSRAKLIVVPFEKCRGINLEGERPDDFLADDVQSTKDAISPTAVNRLMLFLKSDVAFLGSRRHPVSITHNGTVIQPDDFADSLCKEKSFQTVRYKMVEKFPTSKLAEKLWEEYKDIRQKVDEDIEDDDLRARKESLEFYKANRDEMDGDSEVSWEYAYSRKPMDYEISTIQAAYNFIMDWGEDAFESECQNSPKRPDFDSDELTKQTIREKQHGQGQGIVPLEAEFAVCQIDVQGDVLFYTETAGNSKFDSFVIDYGTFPSQKRKMYTKSSLIHTLTARYREQDEETRLYKGIKEFLELQLNKVFKRDGDGASIEFKAIGVDARWNGKVVRKVIRDIGDPRVFAYMGQGIGHNKAPMSAWKEHAGDKKGVHWFLKKANNGVRDLVSDVNFWKSFTKNHMLIPFGQEASITLFSVDHPTHHNLIANHLKSERGKVLTDDSSGRRVEVWEAIPGEDNDLLDTTVGTMALLSFCGAECLGADRGKTTKKRRKSRVL